MVTFAQAQERAERWVNGGVPAYQHREVRVREFGLGFVAWAEGPLGSGSPGGGPGEGGSSSGDGGQRLVIARDSGETTLWPALPVGEVIRRYEEEYGAAAAEPVPPSPPQRVDLEATSFLLTPPEWLQEAADQLGIPDRRGAGGSSGAGVPVASATPPAASSSPASSSPASSSPTPSSPTPAPASPSATPPPASAPAGGSPWDAADTSGSGSGAGSVPPPMTVFAPPISGSDDEDEEAPAARSDAGARTELMPEGSALPRTRLAPALDDPQGPPEQQQQQQQQSPPSPPSGPPEAPGTPPGGVHHAATMLADPSAGGPGTPPSAAPRPPGPPGPPPGAPVGAPGAPGVPSYGYPQPSPGVPTVGPGYMAVLRYRAPDGSEQQLIRRSAPGTPHPEWQILYELRAMGIAPQQVLELHTELECCDAPGGYCARMVRESWPQVRISHTAPYGRDVASRQQGVRQLVEHQGELHQVADGPARPAPVRVPLPQVQPAPPVPPQGVAQELAEAFGPQAVFRFDQRAVSRQGVPEVVAQTLMWAGLPVDFGPFFWAQAQPGRPVPTLAELAQERGVVPAADAGSYLVMGNDFGRQLCVQYGTAHIVAVPLEGGPGGQSAVPQFVNSGLPEFVRCLALLGRMWRLRYGLTPEQAGRWTVDFQAMLACLDPAALAGPENWWSVLLEQMWDGLL
ncbi:SUKH-4 family immunity protein [Streptomyces sp. TRM 70361]|uniref:SUKH-4 family immunity protein n=1 Tax=Streptomyces sp. TRM 70361 TaxID=3116553 RepID=UPI002E7C2537|nr:SUKH-4 family immunity protein [Streptomyces sp. TRM 70361]MEE1938513.1 SUKH-4 family immunity protein [Streptomyces sp. TRM 70361]